MRTTAVVILLALAIWRGTSAASLALSSRDARAQVLPFEAFHQPLSPLYLDYLAGRPRVAPFLGEAGLDLDVLAGAAERAATLPRARDRVSEALARQQRERGAARAAEREL